MHGAPRFSLVTLGSPRLNGPSGESIAATRKEIALLAYLVRHSPRHVSRDRLATLLWGERDETKAKQSLRHAVHQLRRTLGDAIEVHNGSIRVAPGSIRLDAFHFERGVAEGRFADALELWHGDFLAGMDDIAHDEFRGWLEREREMLRRILPSAFDSVVSAARRERRPDDELRWAHQWTECCPLDEVAHSHFIESLMRAGKAGEARVSHAAFQARLRSELDAPPSAESLRLGDEIEQALQHAKERSPGSAALFSPDFVGRDSVLDSLLQLWSRAREHSAVALVEAEEGLGKSRLCAELSKRTRSGGKKALVLHVRALEAHRSEQASTIRRVISTLAESTAIEDAPNRALVELSRIAPEVRRRFPQLASPAEGPSDPDHALRATFGAIATASRILLIVDDFALADATSQELLLSLARSLPAGMMIVLTVRPDQLAGTNLLSELGRLAHARRIRLSPLTQGETALLVDSMLQLSAVDRETIAVRLFSESGGNPFYALQLMSGIADAGMIALTGHGTWSIAPGFHSQSLPLPPSLRAAIKLRLDQLSAPARRLLYVAATSRESLDSAPMQAASGLSLEDSREALDELLSRRLLRLRQDGEPGYEFAHDLIRRLAAEKANGSTPHAQPPIEPRPLSRWSSRQRAAQIGVGLGVAAALVFVFTRSVASGPPPRSGGELSIVVAAFANETGDRRFDRVGRITADWLTRGIAQTGLISVLPPVAHLSEARSPGDGILPEDFPRLSSRIAPSLTISGAIYRSGDSLRFEAQINDARERKVYRVIEPVAAPIADPMTGIETLRKHLLARLAPSLDVRLSSALSERSHTPSYEAYKAFADGLDDLYARRGNAAEKFLRAHDLDSAFMLPLLYTALTYAGWGMYARSDSLVKTIEPKRAQLAPYDRHVLDYLAAGLRTNLTGAYMAAREAALIAPGSYAAVVLAPNAALSLNRPGEAVRLLEQIDREKSAARGLPAFYNVLAHSYHVLGRYEDQLKVGKELRRRIPGENRALYYEARALAAMGRFAELDAVLNEALSLPLNPGYGPPGLGVHLFAAEELRAHGHREKSVAVLERAVRFYQTAPAAIRSIPRFQGQFGFMHYELGRLPEARRILEGLVASKALPGGDNALVTYSLAYVAEKQGDSARVNDLIQYLRANPVPYQAGVVSFHEARLAALRGQKPLAMRLLQQSAAEGLGFSYTTHHVAEFDGMRGYAPFERWLAPKG